MIRHRCSMVILLLVFYTFFLVGKTSFLSLYLNQDIFDIIKSEGG